MESGGTELTGEVSRSKRVRVWWSAGRSVMSANGRSAVRARGVHAVKVGARRAVVFSKDDTWPVVLRVFGAAVLGLGGMELARGLVDGPFWQLGVLVVGASVVTVATQVAWGKEWWSGAARWSRDDTRSARPRASAVPPGAGTTDRHALVRVAERLTGTHDVASVANAVSQEVSALLRVPVVLVFVRKSGSEQLQLAAEQNVRDRLLQGWPLRECEAVESLFAGRWLVTCEDVASAVRRMQWQSAFARLGVRSLVLARIARGGALTGVVAALTEDGPRRHADDAMVLLRGIVDQASIALDHATLFEQMQRLNASLVMAYDSTLEGWSRALDLRDRETEGHTRRVTELTIRLARAMNLGNDELTHVRRGAILHDIGKMGIPDSILLKPGPLTADEWAVMRRHPVLAYELLSPISYLRPALDIPYCHHEKWDGTGYPRGLGGDQIPLAARIFAVADVWDALRSDRPYRPAWDAAAVRQYILELSGTHFDPAVVSVFGRLYHA